MADGKYRPLACGACGGSMSLRLRLNGEPHRTQPSVCSSRCKTARKYGSPVRCSLDERVCVRCSSTFKPKHRVSMYCSKTCKVTACQYRRDRLRGTRWDTRAKEEQIIKAAKLAVKHLTKQIARLQSEQRKLDKHKLNAQRQCVQCDILFCRLMGSGDSTFCSDECRKARARVHKAANRARRKAKQRGATVETVVIDRVLERDNYSCYVCFVTTPKHKRGSYDDDAPEADHVVPLAKGGSHSYANLRCICRACNLKKSDDLTIYGFLLWSKTMAGEGSIELATR